MAIVITIRSLFMCQTGDGNNTLPTTEIRAEWKVSPLGRLQQAQLTLGCGYLSMNALVNCPKVWCKVEVWLWQDDYPLCGHLPIWNPSLLIACLVMLHGVKDLGLYWFGQWSVACLAQCHYLDRCRICNLILGNKLHWDCLMGMYLKILPVECQPFSYAECVEKVYT